MRKLLVHSILGILGGLLYLLIEIAWRGYTHWTMFLVGGICFVLIGLINEVFPWEMPLWQQMASACLLVTIVELIAGIVLNMWLGLGIWDYSQMPFNFMGQICLPYMGLWFLLSMPAIVLEDYLHYWLFQEDKPRYAFV